MTAKIIIQIVLAIIAGGAVAGLIKLPSKQKAIGVFVLLIAIIGSSVGMAIGVGMIAASSILTKQGKLKTGQKLLFFGIGIAIFLVGMVSLITHFKP